MIPKELQEVFNKNAIDAHKHRGTFDTADAIEYMELGARLALEYMGNMWVSVESELPKEHKPYWVFGKDVSHGIDLNVLIDEKAFWDGANWIDDKGKRITQYITHFMPYKLPQPPKTDNDEK